MQKFRIVLLAVACQFVVLASCDRIALIKNQDGKLVRDQETDLVWISDLTDVPELVSPDGTQREMSWLDAEQICLSLEYSGSSDWRLPTVEELETILESPTFFIRVGGKVYRDHDEPYDSSKFEYEPGIYWTSSLCDFDYCKEARLCVDVGQGGGTLGRHHETGRALVVPVTSDNE